MSKALHIIILCLSLSTKAIAFGSECKQIINEHFFDLSSIQSPDDYYFPFKDSTDTPSQVYFNFCQPVEHSCPGTTPNYHMMLTSTSKCMYFTPINDDSEFGKENGGNFLYLISSSGERVSEGVPADGIGSLFQGRLKRHQWYQKLHQIESLL